MRNKVHRGLLLLDEAAEALTELLNLPIVLIQPADMHERAWRLAARFDRPSGYDAYYLAVAEALDCPFWTADRRLGNEVKGFRPGIHIVG